MLVLLEIGARAALGVGVAPIALGIGCSRCLFD
jgi:hypothetical protein